MNNPNRAAAMDHTRLAKTAQVQFSRQNDRPQRKHIVAPMKVEAGIAAAMIGQPAAAQADMRLPRGTIDDSPGGVAERSRDATRATHIDWSAYEQSGVRDGRGDAPGTVSA